MGYYIPRKKLFTGTNFNEIPDVFALERVGAGHDGFVYRDGDIVYKVLKHGIDGRKERGLMSFDKARAFQTLDVNRFIKPTDVLIDEDGIYAGYVMKFYDDLSKEEDGVVRKQIGEFTCEDFLASVDELSSDVSELTKKGLVIKDINRGSYIFSSDFLHICDMDKYFLNRGQALRVNWNQLNYIVAKMMYFEKMEREGFFKDTEFANEINKRMNKWVSKVTNSSDFIRSLEKELSGSSLDTPISEFVDYTFQKVIV